MRQRIRERLCILHYRIKLDRHIVLFLLAQMVNTLREGIRDTDSVPLLLKPTSKAVKESPSPSANHFKEVFGQFSHGDMALSQSF